MKKKTIGSLIVRFCENKPLNACKLLNCLYCPLTEFNRRFTEKELKNESKEFISADLRG